MRFALLCVLTCACTDPVAPMVPACDDSYRPAMCMDGEEVCETDDRGCRMCTCELPEQ